MQLQSVRALKAEIAERIVGPMVAEAREGRFYGAAARALKRATGVEPAVALGVAKGARLHDFRLAVRLQRRAFEALPALRSEIESLSRHEVDIRYIGRVMKSARSPAATAPWHRSRQRPLLIGASIGHVAVTAGTLGAFALHRKTQKLVILSNNHVLANEDAGKLGDIVIQPGAHDGGKRRSDRVGALLDFVPLKNGGGNLVDAAIASIDAGIDIDAATLTGFGALAGLRQDILEPGAIVLKVGRTTGVTRGLVTAIEVDDLVIGYDRGDLSFDRQIEIEGADTGPFSDGGDSGSIIVDEQGLACALLFAGSDQGGSNGAGLTYANDLVSALQQLDAELALSTPAS